MNFLEQALEFEKQGYSVFPLFEGTKNKPLVQWRAFMSRRPTELEIRDWWTKFPNANIALVMGDISGIFVLDTEKEFDPFNLPGMIHSRTAKTGSGGRHYYFKIPKGKKIPTFIEIWGKEPAFKADIKGEGGYVVAPPSHNAEKNSDYEWIDEIEDIEEPPVWLLNLVDKLEKNKSKSPSSFDDLALGVEEGSRNIDASSFIGHILLKTPMNMWEVVCWPAVKSWNERNEPPLDERELRGVFDSISRREYTRRDEPVTNGIDKDSLINYQGPDRVDSFEAIQTEINNEKKPEFKFMCKIPTLDELCDGFVPGEVIVVSGPAKHGKTSLLTSMTTSFSDQGIKSLWFSFEMLPREFLKKFKDKLPISYMSKQQKDRDMKWLEERIIEAKLKYGVQVVFIDHLHFLFDILKSRNPSLELGSIVRTLKSIARDNEMVVFLIVHIRRRESGRAPNEDDLRDSALLSAEADSTIMIWRIPLAKGKKGHRVEYGCDAALKICNHRRTGVLGRALRVKYQNGVYKEISGNYDESGDVRQEDVETFLAE